MNKLKTYKSLDTIPVYNYYKLVESSDFRYLIVDVDLNDLPKIKDYTELRQAYKVLSNSVTDVDMTLQMSFIKFLQLFYKYQKNKVSMQKVNDAFNRYCKELDNHYKNYKYKDLVFESAILLRNYLRENARDFNDYLMQRYVILDYNNVDAEKIGSWDINGDILAIKQILNVDVDEFKCSMSKFLRFKKEAVRQVNKKRAK